MPNFFERIAEAAVRFPRHTAVEWIGAGGAETAESTTYEALLDQASRAAGWLTGRAGLARGDRIAILAANDARWIAVYLGALRRGLVVVPLDTAYTPTQVRTVLSDSGARVLFTTARYLANAHNAIAGEGAVPRLALLSGAAADVVADTEWLAETDAHAPEPVGPDDAAVILYTSGTTADPKGVVLTHANLDAERAAVLSVVEADDRDVVLGVLPLFHALAEMANLWLPLSIGARLVFLETVSSTTLLDALQTRGVTILACVPQFFYLIHQRVIGEIGRRGVVARALFRALIGANTFLRDRTGWNPGRRIFARVHHALGPRMRLLITGGSRFDPGIARDLYGLGVSLYNGYGLTETSGAASIVRRGDRFTTSVGPPIPGVEIRIAPRSAGDAADPSARERSGGSGPPERESARRGAGDPADPREDGEILIRGPIVMPGYWRRPDATAEVIKRGWLHTGDLGTIDRDGRVFITGRLKEVIVLSSGKNLYPEEIEAHYRQSPFIKELCVLGLSRPGEPAAERLHAVVVPDEQVMRERGIVNFRELIRFEIEGLAVSLPAHKRILSYDISLDPLARTTTGKLRRNEIERRTRERQSAPATERQLTEGERGWLAEGEHDAIVRAIAGDLSLQHVTPEANLELDLGLDSMERIELLTKVERRLRRRVTPEARATIFTVRQLVDAIERAAPWTDGRGEALTESSLPWETVLAEPADPALASELGRSKAVRAFTIWLGLRVALAAARLVMGVRVSGREHIPARGPFIVSPNHQTFLDGFFVAAALPFRAFRDIFFVGAAEFFETRLMAWGARAINIVPVDADANLVSAMRAAATGLSLGKVLILFPEGERTIDGTVKPFRKGAAILASNVGAPIVPTAINGFFPIWPRGRSFQWGALAPWRGRKTITFGPPLRVTRGEYAGGTDELQRAVMRTLADSTARSRRDAEAQKR